MGSLSLQERDTATMLVVGRLTDLECRINSKTLGRIRDLEVESLGDSIILSGTSTTYYAKQLATQLVQEEYAEYPLQNDIAVV